MTHERGTGGSNMTRTGIFKGRVQIPYAYGRYGWTRGGGKTWHGGIDLVGLDDPTICMPYYTAADGAQKAIRGTVTRARKVDRSTGDPTWEWGWYVCVQHSGNAALNDPPYKHCHLEARATATGTGLDPTAYAGVPNAAGTYGSAEEEQPGSVSELRSIQLVTVGPLSAGEAARVAALAGSLRLGADRYSMLQVDAAHFAAAMTVSNGDAMRVVQLAEKEGWDKRKLYHSRFVG